jgi:hypothetical protein
LFLAGCVALAVYLGVRFVPLYLQASKVDSVLKEACGQAKRYNPEKLYSQRERLLDYAYNEVRKLGIDDSAELQVYFSPRLDTLHADYTIALKHPLVGEKEHKFRRSCDIIYEPESETQRVSNQ